MQILAFTDIHNSKEALKELASKGKDTDLILCAGDLSAFGSGLKQTVKAIAAIGKKTLMIHGNHEEEHELAAECAKYPHLVFLHKQFYEQDGFMFCGYGGGGFATQDKKFEQFTHKILERTKGKPLIMMFHGPPHGNKTDFLPLYGNVGNKSYSAAIKAAKPILVVCGHLHENFGERDTVGKSLVINPGPLGMTIRLER